MLDLMFTKDGLNLQKTKTLLKIWSETATFSSTNKS